jgi:hypothetical protein
MALQPHRLEFKPRRLEFIFGMVLAMAVTILAITTWAAPRIPRAIRLRRSRRFTGLNTGICTKGYRLSKKFLRATDRAAFVRRLVPFPRCPFRPNSECPTHPALHMTTPFHGGQISVSFLHLRQGRELLRELIPGLRAVRDHLKGSVRTEPAIIFWRQISSSGQDGLQCPSCARPRHMRLGLPAAVLGSPRPLFSPCSPPWSAAASRPAFVRNNPL